MAAITRKPQAPSPEHQAHEAAIQAVINKGLTTAQEQLAPDEEKQRQVVVFIPESLLEAVDTLVKAVRPRTSRRSWLVEAIREKVERDRDIG
jgi:hydroxylamine reductase (hybrid-cluster protein)